jgi:hypothetical protein
VKERERESISKLCKFELKESEIFEKRTRYGD